MTDQVIIGMDPHKSSNTITVLARDETMLTRRRFPHSDDGFVEMLDAVAGFPDRVWPIEGANGMGRSCCRIDARSSSGRVPRRGVSTVCKLITQQASRPNGRPSLPAPNPRA